MPINLYEEGLTYAKKLIEDGNVVRDEKDNWSEDQPTIEKQNAFLKHHGTEAYGKWFLGVNTDKSEQNKDHYEFPYGDFTQVHRGGIIAAKIRAGQYHHADIEKAADYLLSMIDKDNQS